MADILISGIGMPKEGQMLYIDIYPDGKVAHDFDLSCKQIATAVSVPSHGRLIDADALLKDVREHSESYFAEDFAHEWVDVAPTIIPASKRK
jgi:hypothetical protein